MTAGLQQPIHIVTSYPGPLGGHYMLARFQELWQAEGRQVTVGPLSRLERGLGLLHVDSTRLAPALVPQVTSPARLLNARVLDISKRRFSELLVGEESDWDGPVILKTDANFHGLPEAGQRRAGALQRLRTRLPWRLTRQLPPSDYPVLPHRKRVPDWVWRREDLIVERFIPEYDGSAYVLRLYVFFGDRGIVYRLRSERPIIKSEGILSFEAAYAEPPPEIAAARQQMGFDFGKFDYVLHEGRPVLLDVNKTPSVAGRSQERMRYLAGGLDRFLADCR